MEKRKFVSIGEEVSLLGFGCMRLPRLQPNQPEIDYQAGQDMVDLALAQGVNYFDTAYLYHEGLSEPFIGQALKKHPRESFFLASKMPTWPDLVQTADDVERIFQQQLERCQVEYFDFYLIHNLNTTNFANAEKVGIYDILRRKQRQGLIRRLGFSFHDNAALMERVVAAHDWDFAQIQLNYLDWEALEAKKLYEILVSRNIPVVIMEPVRGGVLATLNEECRGMLKEADPNRSIASWAIRFAASLPGVMTVLSGMTTLEQVADNLRTMEPFQPLTEQDYRLLEKVVATYRAAGAVPCTGCRYCMDCPAGVNIPQVFAVYNHYRANQNPINFRNNYHTLQEEGRADRCVACGQCMEHCPQQIDIPRYMEEIRKLAVELEF